MTSTSSASWVVVEMSDAEFDAQENWERVVRSFPRLRSVQPWHDLPNEEDWTWDKEPKPIDDAISDWVIDAHYARVDRHDYLVERELQRLKAREDAKKRLALETALAAQPFDIGLLGDILQRPKPPPHRIEGLIPSDASTLVVAQRKTGKTTLMLNLARCLLTGEPFLGAFETRPVEGIVALLNYEVSGDQASRWADEVGVPRHQLLLANLRGRRNPLAFDEDRAQLVAHLRKWSVEAVIVDPFGRAYSGASQNDSGEVGSWLVRLDEFARGEAGVKDLILTAHAGWDGERTRGSSALEDWADSIITLVRGKDDGDERYLRAEGRDVSVDEDQLRYDPATRLLTVSGAGSRKVTTKNRRIDSLVGYVTEELEGGLALSGYEIEKRWRIKGLSFQKGEANAAGRRGVERGLIVSEPGIRNSTIFRLNPSPPRPPQTSPGGTLDDLPDLPFKGGGRPGDVTEADLPGDVDDVEAAS